MKRRNIATKVFKIISLSLFILLSVQLIFQTLFLEKLYIYNKKTSISKEIKGLTSRLITLPENEISKALRLFSQEFGSTTGVVTPSGIPLYGFDSQIAFMEVEIGEGTVYKVYLTDFLENDECIERLQPDQNVQLTVMSNTTKINAFYPSIIKIEEEIFTPQTIMRQITQAISTVKSEEAIAHRVPDTIPQNNVSYIILSEPIQTAQEIEIEGKIKEVYIPGEEIFGNGYRENKILEEMNLFIEKARKTNASLELEKPIIYESIDTYVGIRNIMSIVPVIIKGEANFLISMTSLEQVEEAIGMMNNYTFVVFVLALIVAVLLAYWYAKKLTSPLVALKDITTSITNLDFSKTCTIQSEDEIGELASNINMMSTKLKHTLEKLQEDMAFKERLGEQRKQFIVDISHELKTPLTVLKATCEGFRDDIYGSNDKSQVQNMLGQIDAMSELVQELLAVARLEQEETLKMEVFDLSHSVLKAHTQLKYLAKEKNITVHMQLAESIVKADRKKIETVIKNFYSNAIFYTPSNEDIYITLAQEENEWRFQIENTGVHIAVEEIEKIWEPFYRVDQSRNKALGGSGLGLYIVKKLLDSHGKEYGLENTLKGVRAWFKLDVAKEIDGYHYF